MRRDALPAMFAHAHAQPLVRQQIVNPPRQRVDVERVDNVTAFAVYDQFARAAKACRHNRRSQRQRLQIDGWESVKYDAWRGDDIG